MKTKVTVKKLLAKYKVERNRPKNFDQADERCFSAEWTREFNPVNLYSVKNAWVDSGGIVARKNFKIIPSSLVNLRKKGAKLKSVLSHMLRLMAKKPVSDRGKYIWISERWSSGYFHWFCDALPRYYIARKHLSSQVILLPEHYRSFPYVLESLDYLGLSYGFIERGTRHYCEEIHYSDLLALPGNYHPPTMKLLKDEIRKHSSSSGSDERIFISRQKARIRKIINMDECAPIIEKHGFRIVVLEDLDFDQQMSKLSSAKVIMGVHGAGFTNMLAVPNSCKVIEMRGKNDTHNNCFFSLAEALDLDYYYFFCQENPTSNDIVGNVNVDADALDQFLTRYFPNS